jgi:hypothetical protein
MKKLFLWGLGLLATGFALLLVIAGIAGPHLPQAAAAAPSAASAPIVKPMAFSNQVLIRLGYESPKWREIRFDPDNSDKNISITIVYRRTPSGYAEVQADTARVARAALQTLMANGRNPHAEWIFISVRAQEPAGQGETGADMTRIFGTTHYDFNSDQLVFEGPRRSVQ